MKNKKVAIIFIIIVIIVAILAGIYKVMSSYLFTEDWKIEDGHKELVEKIKNIEDYDTKKKQANFFRESNKINEQDAKEILGE